jgi:hypothetical protein
MLTNDKEKFECSKTYRKVSEAEFTGFHMLPYLGQYGRSRSNMKNMDERAKIPYLQSRGFRGFRGFRGLPPPVRTRAPDFSNRRECIAVQRSWSQQNTVCRRRVQ